MLPKKKRCCICRKLFRPDTRVGERQRACGAPSCQHQRRVRTQARWRSDNPSYQKDYRTRQRAAQAEAAERGETDPPPSHRLPPELTTFPWGLAEATLGFTGAEILTLLAVLMVRLVHEVKDEKFVDTPLPKGAYAPSSRDP
jgi:hypothetical protein